MVGKKIRAYREFRGYSQIQLAELSGINVGTIRKYELGIRNPKPDQLEKIATALGLNVSVFLDFNIETVGDVLSILFAIDDSVNLSLSETSDQKIAMTFDNPTMQDFFKKWCQFKNVYEKEKAEILAIKDENKRQEELDKLNATQEEWKLRAMGTTIGCHVILNQSYWSVTMTVRFHLFPFRTQKLSSLVPKIVRWKRRVKIGSRRLKCRDV